MGYLDCGMMSGYVWLNREGGISCVGWCHCTIGGLTVKTEVREEISAPVSL
jgi:hypothetical protein